MRTILILAAVLAIAVPVEADHCTTFSTSAPDHDTTVDADGVPRYYVDIDYCHVSQNNNECLFSIWLYEETNGIDGLQRGDEVVDDTCGGLIEADTIWS